MLRNIFSNREILVGVSFFALTIFGSLFYMWHVNQDIKAENTRSQRFLRQIETNSRNKLSTETGQSTEPTDALENEVLVEAENFDEMNSIVLNNTEDANGGTSEASAQDIITEAEIEEIIAEEEMAQEALSAEELRKQELKQQQADIFEQIKALMATEGGALDSSTDKEKMEQMLLLQKELLHLQQEIEGTSDSDANYFMDLAMMVNRGVNHNGEMPVSEALKIADYMDAEGSVESANTMRAVIQRAIDSGDEIIKSEHIEAFR